MRLTDLKEEIEIELELIETTAKELLALYRDVSGRSPTEANTKSEILNSKQIQNSNL